MDCGETTALTRQIRNTATRDGRGPACVHNYLMNALYFCNSEEIEAKADSIAREKLITSCKNANVVNVLRRPIGERITSEVMVR